MIFAYFREAAEDIVNKLLESSKGVLKLAGLGARDCDQTFYFHIITCTKKDLFFSFAFGSGFVPLRKRYE